MEKHSATLRPHHWLPIITSAFSFQHAMLQVSCVSSSQLPVRVQQVHQAKCDRCTHLSKTCHLTDPRGRKGAITKCATCRDAKVSCNWSDIPTFFAPMKIRFLENQLDDSLERSGPTYEGDRAFLATLNQATSTAAGEALLRTRDVERCHLEAMVIGLNRFRGLWDGSGESESSNVE